MKKKRIPKSLRKFIRKEKARIRREVFNMKEQEKLINELYEKLLNNPRKSAKAAPTKQNIKNKQPAAPSPAESGARISVNPVRDYRDKEETQREQISNGVNQR